MAQNRFYFLIGLFVTVGVLIGVAAVIWLGASKYFQKGSMYATYFDESVQGLQRDSVVKFRGVDIGTVRQIGVAPDQRLVEVLMKIEVKDFNVNGVVAKLTLAGITGIVYVELDRKKRDEQSFAPAGFQPLYPVIPSAPSDIKQIESSVNEVLKRIREIDFAGISTEVIKTTKAINGLVNNDKMKGIMRDAGVAAGKLADASEKIDNFVAGGSVNEVVAEAAAAVKEARAVIAQVKTEIEGIKMAHTAGVVNRFVERTSTKVDSTLTEVQLTAETLRRAADSLETLIDRINADPSALIFSHPLKGE
jgi:phospholipid/cholesterol/gamma-HCH transport system substrate-binding protein